MDSNPPEFATRPIEVVPTRVGYDRWAESYDDEDNPLILLEERFLPPLLGDVRGRDVLDVGCGTGRHSVRLAAAGARVTAMDFSDEMVACARRKPLWDSVRFITHDLAEPFPFERETFDIVLNCLVLEHIADLAALLREMRRVCRAGGFVLISAMHPAMLLRGVQARFTEPSSGIEIRPAGYPHSISDYVRAVTRAGLRVEHMSEHAADAELASVSPRARKYLDWPVLILMRLIPGL